MKVARPFADLSEKLAAAVAQRRRRLRETFLED